MTGHANHDSDDAGGDPGDQRRANPLYDRQSGAGKELDASSSLSSDCEDSFSDSDSDNDGDEQDGENDEQEVEEVDGEDPLIKALKAAKEEAPRTHPPDIRFSRLDLMDISMHPTNNLIASSIIDGEIDIFEFAKEGNKLVKKLKIHKRAVRSVEYDSSGRHLVSGCTDKTVKITDIETSKVVFKSMKSHNAALYKVKPMTQNLLATGDEDGVVKLWDNRVRPDAAFSTVMESKPFDDFVSDIYFNSTNDPRVMVATSGEGTLNSFNIRGKRPDVQSEVYEGELTSMGLVHRDSKLVVGCGDGKLYMFNWGQFGFHSADFPGHPDSINALVSVTDNVVLTACEDGEIRAVHLYPHRFLGVVGHHGDHFPVERLDVSANGDVVASISHDQRIKFWDISFLEEINYRKTKKPFLRRKGNFRRKDFKIKQAKEAEFQLPSSKRGNRRDFFRDI